MRTKALKGVARRQLIFEIGIEVVEVLDQLACQRERLRPGVAIGAQDGDTCELSVQRHLVEQRRAAEASCRFDQQRPAATLQCAVDRGGEGGADLLAPNQRGMREIAVRHASLVGLWRKIGDGRQSLDHVGRTRRTRERIARE